MQRPAAGALLLFLPLLCALFAGCLGDGAPAMPKQALAPGAERKAFDVQAREFDLVADRDDRSHLAMAFITPRADPVSPSWLAFAATHDAGATWEVRRLCGDPLDPAALAEGAIGCPHWGARLTSDPILMQLDDGAFLYVGVALRADEVTLFASRHERDAMDPTWTTVVSRSAFNAFPGAHMAPAPYQVYYNGKPNVMQASDGRLHLVWAADLGIENDAGPMVTTGIPFATASGDGGRTWSTPVKLATEGFTDVAAIYAVGVEAFETRDGRLHAVWWESWTNQLVQVSSSDGGATWTEPRAIASVVGRPDGARVDSDNVTRPWVGVDRSGGGRDGTVYVLADDKSGGDRDLVLLRSADDGATWDARTPAGLPSANGRDETMARLLVEPSGAVAILYPSWDQVERLEPFDMHLARSVDGGETFQSVRLSS
ncbi:MAG TPA: sialidase family protein, partial [Candidatus Thermoplasmatota archaeon]|nr:sialidase family protein [Candidatus Thermoplasmatota archaeon]